MLDLRWANNRHHSNTLEISVTLMGGKRVSFTKNCPHGPPFCEGKPEKSQQSKKELGEKYSLGANSAYAPLNPYVLIPSSWHPISLTTRFEAFERIPTKFGWRQYVVCRIFVIHERIKSHGGFWSHTILRRINLFACPVPMKVGLSRLNSS